MGRTCSTYLERKRRGAYRVFVGKPDGKRPIGRPMRKWENNMEMNLREV